MRGIRRRIGRGGARCNGLAVRTLLLVVVTPGCNAILDIDVPRDPPFEHEAEDPDAATEPSDDPEVTPSDGGAPQDAGAPHALYAWATWPMPNPAASDAPNPQRYDASSSELVIDQVTGLSWQRVTEPRLLPWEEASAYCENLGLSGRRFRLPSRIELLSLLNPTLVNPAIDLDAFPDSPAQLFWSASPVAREAALAWAVSFGFNTGFTFRRSRGEALHVRCVEHRAEVPVGVPFAAEGEIVAAQGMHLTWERGPATGPLSWQEAHDYCASLDVLGGGFRLPTLKELHTLVDERAPEPAIDLAIFPGTMPGLYWSSTPLAKFPLSRWVVNFANGTDGWSQQDAEHYVRCVR